MFYVMDGSFKYDDPTVAVFENEDDAIAYIEENDNGDYYYCQD